MKMERQWLTLDQIKAEYASNDYNPELLLQHLLHHVEASTASVPEGFKTSELTILPDGSAFATMSFPLPEDHWLYKEREYADEVVLDPKDLPAPILSHTLRQQIVGAARYAIRASTNCGKEDDFDPDAMVQNMVYALCGPFNAADPTPPVQDNRKDAERWRWITREGRNRELRIPASENKSSIDTAIDKAMEGK